MCDWSFDASTAVGDNNPPTATRVYCINAPQSSSCFDYDWHSHNYRNLTRINWRLVTVTEALLSMCLLLFSFTVSYLSNAALCSALPLTKSNNELAMHSKGNKLAHRKKMTDLNISRKLYFEHWARSFHDIRGIWARGWGREERRNRAWTWERELVRVCAMSEWVRKCVRVRVSEYDY